MASQPSGPCANDIVIPSYASPASATPLSNWLVKFAVACALLPLAAGLLCFLGWVISSSFFFALGGFATIGFGILLSGLGLIALIVHYILSVARSDALIRRWIPRRGHWIAMALLAINYPIAYGLNSAVQYIDKYYVVVVQNTGATPVDDFAVSFDSDTVHFGKIAAGGSAKRRVHLVAPSGNFTLTQSGVQTHGSVADSYVRADSLVTIHNGAVTIVPSPTGNVRSHLCDNWE